MYIIKGEGEETVPLDCPICKLSLRDLSDAVSYESYKCCVECRDEFIFKNKDDWSSGKRPTKEQIDDFRKNLRSRPSYLLS